MRTEKLKLYPYQWEHPAPSDRHRAALSETAEEKQEKFNINMFLTKFETHSLYSSQHKKHKPALGSLQDLVIMLPLHTPNGFMIIQSESLRHFARLSNHVASMLSHCGYD